MKLNKEPVKWFPFTRYDKHGNIIKTGYFPTIPPSDFKKLKSVFNKKNREVK